MDHRQDAVERHATGGRDHVLLGDAAFDETIRQLGFGRLNPAIREQVAVQNDDLLPYPRHLQQLVSVREHEPLRLGRHDPDGLRCRRHRQRSRAQRQQPGVHARGDLADRAEIVLQ